MTGLTPRRLRFDRVVKNFKYRLFAVPSRWYRLLFPKALVFGKETTRLQLERVRIPIRDLDPDLEGFRVVHMSDLHLYPFTREEHVREAVELALSLRGDLVALTGDFVLWELEAISALAPILGELRARYGVFAVLGNHDVLLDASRITTSLEDAGIQVLHNRGLTLPVGLNVAGVDDAWGEIDFDAAMQDLAPGRPTLLLAHEPDLADTFALDGRVSLQLSGHSHGGQVRVRWLAPRLPRLGRKYFEGLHRVGEMWVYTTRGVGLGAPFRVNCPPEVTEVTLVNEPPRPAAPGAPPPPDP